jgi:hypothetical protein
MEDEEVSVEGDIPWDRNGSSGKRKSGVNNRKPLPMTEELRAFRKTLPDIHGMKIGKEYFVPTLSTREEFVVMTAVRKANNRHEDRRWFCPIEWRHHIRGRLVVCVHPDRAEEWRALMSTMRLALLHNRRLPPLDARGNCLVPRLPVA